MRSCFAISSASRRTRSVKSLAVLATGMAAILIHQHRTHDRLIGENEALRAQLVRQSQLEAENERLAGALATAIGARTNVPSPSRDQFIEMLRLRLQQADEEFARLSELHAQNLADETSLARAKQEVELRCVEQSGDRIELLRTRLLHAEEELARLTSISEQKLIGDAELNRAAMEVELLRAKRGAH